MPAGLSYLEFAFYRSVLGQPTEDVPTLRPTVFGSHRRRSQRLLQGVTIVAHKPNENADGHGAQGLA